MLYWAIIFMLLSFISGILGFTEISLISAEIVQFTFVVFLILFFVSAMSHIFGNENKKLE